MRLVQLSHHTLGRKVAIVIEPKLILINNYTSIFELANDAIHKKVRLSGLAQDHISGEELD